MPISFNHLGVCRYLLLCSIHLFHALSKILIGCNNMCATCNPSCSLHDRLCLGWVSKKLFSSLNPVPTASPFHTLAIKERKNKSQEASASTPRLPLIKTRVTSAQRILQIYLLGGESNPALPRKTFRFPYYDRRVY